MDDITAGWFKYVNDLNTIEGYPNSHAASLDHTELEERWKRECPGLELPQGIWSNEAERYELHDLSRPKRQSFGMDSVLSL